MTIFLPVLWDASVFVSDQEHYVVQVAVLRALTG